MRKTVQDKIARIEVAWKGRDNDLRASVENERELLSRERELLKQWKRRQRPSRNSMVHKQLRGMTTSRIMHGGEYCPDAGTGHRWWYCFAVVKRRRNVRR